jgi:two-component system phosphate regulon response regulator PhoB
MAAQILIVEDEPHLQELISVNLKRAGYGVQVALDAQAAKPLLDEALPDLVLMDWMLPGMSGLDFTRQLRSDPRTRYLPIIIVSARVEERDKITGLEVGADDYITKPFSIRELMARVAVALRRRVPLATTEIVSFENLVIDPLARTFTAGGVPVAVGPTEFRLLHFMMTHPNRVCSRPQLLTEVWGSDFAGDERTVDVHVSRLRNALKPGGFGHLLRTVHGMGYILSASE